MTSVVQLSAARQKSAPDNADLPYLLINPPLTDPTYPYHSISYLVANCEAYGFTGHRCLDANLDALNHLAAPEQVSELLAEAREFRAAAERLPGLTRGQEIHYQAALAAEGLEPDFVTRAVAVLRDPQDFHHYPTYRQATLAIHRWFQLLSLRSLPGVFSGLTLRTAGAVNYQSHGDLADPEVLDAVNGAFLDYIRGPFRDILRSRPWRLVGLSVNYAAQLPFALRMAREIREQVPDAVVVFGGTEVCDDVKYARDDADVWRMFPHADLIVPGEGETPLVDILCAVRDGAGFAGLPGVLHRGADRRAMRINYEHVGALPAPKYDVWDWEAYWSPEPVVLYSPTRGCYWNKCTFCDYGLNTDRPTSPSRERPVARVLEDLAGIASFARTLYFSVDAMSPRFLRELCDGLTGAGLGLRWSAELRLERTFPARGTAARLRDAGCVAIAFGYESASQRILDLIDKGVRIEQVPEILRELAAAGIGAQMMGFTGFPGETAEEAEETYAFLARHRELWSLAGVGGFSLTPGSIVARRPERFGIEVLPLPREHDIARQLSWRDLDSGVTTHGEARRPVPQALKAQIRRGLGGRPFVGGIDSSHTLLYFAANGRGLLPDRAAEPARHRLAVERVVPVGFQSLDAFATVSELEAEHARLAATDAGVRHRAVRAWLDAPGRSVPGRSAAIVLAGGGVAAVPKIEGIDLEKALRGLDLVLSPGQAVVHARG